LTAPGTALAAPIAAQDLAAQDNEQLEFLGDAVLGFVTSHELFQRFPDYTEGELSKLRAQLVSARHLIHTARELQLGEYLRLGRGEEKSGGRGKAALLVDALEAVVAALFLDAGLEVARDFVLLWVLSPELDGRQGGVESLVSQVGVAGTAACIGTSRAAVPADFRSRPRPPETFYAGGRYC
jgi:ribonuclease-3